MEKSDRIRLHHMHDATKEALSLAQGKSRKELDGNRMLILSLVKLIEIIGEAANRVSTDCKNSFQVIPWEDIIGMRNRLIHAYFDINLDIVWNTVKEELPSLEKKLAKIIGTLPEK